MAAAYPGVSDEDAAAVACTEPDPATKDYTFQQTMLRIKDPLKSIDFYTRIMGMKLIAKVDLKEVHVSTYLFGYCETEEIPETQREKILFALARPGILELAHNWKVGKDPNFKYHNGNSQPQGFSHIGICVPDVGAACKRFKQLNVQFAQLSNELTAKMKGYAFIKDPDGYWIEIINPASMLPFLMVSEPKLAVKRPADEPPMDATPEKEEPEEQSHPSDTLVPMPHVSDVPIGIAQE